VIKLICSCSDLRLISRDYNVQVIRFASGDKTTDETNTRNEMEKKKDRLTSRRKEDISEKISLHSITLELILLLLDEKFAVK